MQFFDGMASPEAKAAGAAGTILYNLPADTDKQYTQWVFRDFVEHLPDAGAGTAAEFLKLKTYRILDTPIWCRREPIGDAELNMVERKNAEDDGGPFALIGGREVDPSLLDDLVSAAQALMDRSEQSPAKQTSPPVGSYSVDELIAQTGGSYSSKWDSATPIARNGSTFGGMKLMTGERNE